MARKSIDPSLAELAAKRSARRARLSKPERANDTRSKARLDAFFLPRFENASDPEFTNRLGDCFHRELPGLLTLIVTRRCLRIASTRSTLANP
ncbi:mobilization protein [Ensifer sp. 22564]|jgi:hypothetical protein|uniref:mobilization protein n=1 Tax=unclassified Ensifer TaxID=2633371 RepID=UPI000AE083E3